METQGVEETWQATKNLVTDKSQHDEDSAWGDESSDISTVSCRRQHAKDSRVSETGIKLKENDMVSVVNFDANTMTIYLQNNIHQMTIQDFSNLICDTEKTTNTNILRPEIGL